jgi:hypothetical protein
LQIAGTAPGLEALPEIYSTSRIVVNGSADTSPQ